MQTADLFEDEDTLTQVQAAKSDDGVFTVHRIKDRSYYESPKAQLGREFLWVSQIARTTLGAGYGGQAAGNRVVRWERRGDRMLLCSDGVSNGVTDDELRAIMTGSDPREACVTMIALCNDRGGLDNQTAIVADFSGDGLDPPDEFETITTTYEVLQRYDSSSGKKGVSGLTVTRGGPEEPLPPLDAAGGDPAQTMRLPKRGVTMMHVAVIVAAIAVAVLLFMAARA